MLCFKPEQTIGLFKGLEILLKSSDPTQDMTSFDAYCKQFEEHLKEVYTINATKDHSRA